MEHWLKCVASIWIAQRWRMTLHFWVNIWIKSNMAHHCARHIVWNNENTVFKRCAGIHPRNSFMDETHLIVDFCKRFRVVSPTVFRLFVVLLVCCCEMWHAVHAIPRTYNKIRPMWKRFRSDIVWSSIATRCSNTRVCAQAHEWDEIAHETEYPYCEQVNLDKPWSEFVFHSAHFYTDFCISIFITCLFAVFWIHSISLWHATQFLDQ